MSTVEAKLLQEALRELQAAVSLLEEPLHDDRLNDASCRVDHAASVLDRLLQKRMEAHRLA